LVIDCRGHLFLNVSCECLIRLHRIRHGKPARQRDIVGDTPLNFKKHHIRGMSVNGLIAQTPDFSVPTGVISGIPATPSDAGPRIYMSDKDASLTSTDEAQGHSPRQLDDDGGGGGQDPAHSPAPPTPGSSASAATSPASTTGTAARRLAEHRRDELLLRSREKLRRERQLVLDVESEVRLLENQAEQLEPRVEAMALATAVFGKASSDVLVAASVTELSDATLRLNEAETAADEAETSQAIALGKLSDMTTQLQTAERSLKEVLESVQGAETERARFAPKREKLSALRPALRAKRQDLDALNRMVYSLRQGIEAQLADQAPAIEAAKRACDAISAADERQREWGQQAQASAAAIADALATFHDRQVLAERDAQTAKNRKAFEQRVAKDRRAKMEAEAHTTRVAALTIESEVHAIEEQERNAARVEDFEALEETIARYEYDLQRLKQELALRPTAEELPVMRKNLEDQVLRLSAEHARLQDDLALIAEGEAGRAKLLDKCEDLRLRVDYARHTALPEAERRIAGLRAAVHEAKVDVDRWHTDEGPRHAAFEARLTAEQAELEQKVASFHAASAAAARQRADEKDAVVRRIRHLRGELRKAGVDIAQSARITVEAGPDEPSPQAPGRGNGVNQSTVDSPTRADQDVEVEVVVHSPARPAADPDATPAPVRSRVTRHTVRQPGRPLLYDADVNRPSGGSGGPGSSSTNRHFNFLAVSMVQRMVGYIRTHAFAGPNHPRVVAGPRIAVVV
jgi:hypothetical protein